MMPSYSNNLNGTLLIGTPELLVTFAVIPSNVTTSSSGVSSFSIFFISKFCIISLVFTLYNTENPSSSFATTSISSIWYFSLSFKDNV